MKVFLRLDQRDVPPSPPPTHEHVPLKYSLDQNNKFDAEIDGIHALR